MEHSPSDNETGAANKDASKKSKKKAEAIGAMLVEPKSEKSAPAEKKQSWFRLKESEEVTPSATAPENVNEQSVETLDEAREKPYVIDSIVQAHRVADAEATVETPLEGPEAAAQAAVERFRDRLTLEHMEPAEALATTLDEVAAETDIDQTAEQDATEDEAAAAEQPSTEILHDFDDSVVEVDHEPDAHAADPGAGRGGTVPPATPPAPPTRGGPGGGSFFGMNHNVYSAPARIVATEKEYVPVYNRNDMFGAAVVGGIVGYLIGRRRGRIKTEKKLMPIQKKLHKQVENLQSDLAQKEMTIRKTARDAARERHWAAAVPIRAERTTNETLKEQTERRERAAAPEAHQLHGVSSREKIGKVLIGAETRPSSKQPESFRIITQKEQALSKKEIQTMTRGELLALSEKIVVDGSSLRQIYETHLVGERGLRRLVAEHLHGGNVKKALRREMVEREIDFERDPAMRDRPGQAADSPVAGSVTLNGLLQKADADIGHTQSEQVAFLKARAAYESKQQDRQRHQRTYVDALLTGTIVILISLVTILIIRGN